MHKCGAINEYIRSEEEKQITCMVSIGQEWFDWMMIYLEPGPWWSGLNLRRRWCPLQWTVSIYELCYPTEVSLLLQLTAAANDRI